MLDEASSLNQLRDLVGGVAGEQEPVSRLHLVGESHEGQRVATEGCRDSKAGRDSQSSTPRAAVITGRRLNRLHQKTRLFATTVHRQHTLLLTRSHDWGARPVTPSAVRVDLSQHLRLAFVGSGSWALAAFSAPPELFPTHCPKQLLLNPHSKIFKVQYRDFKQT